MAGEKYLKISGILLVIIGFITSVIYGAAGLLLGVSSSGIHDPLMALGGTLVTLAFTALLITGILQLVAGILALKYSTVYQRANILLIIGIIMLATTLASWLIYGNAGSFSLKAIINLICGLIIPGLYTYGAYLNKKNFI